MSHRKAHRKTNRRKTSSDHSPPQTGPDSDPEALAELRRPVCTRSGPPVDSEPPSHLRPCCSWQEERREAPPELVPSDRGRLLDQTIEEVSVFHDLDIWFPTHLIFNVTGVSPQVIQKCCHGLTSTSCHEEMLFFSLPVSVETQSDDRDSIEQVSQEKA